MKATSLIPSKDTVLGSILQGRRTGERLAYSLLVLLVVVVASLTIPTSVKSQFVPCEIVNLSVRHPDSVPAGQTLQVSVLITSSCDASVTYTLRVDLVDQRTGNVLSSVKMPYYPTAPGFIQPINNTATAPSTLGSWVLQDQVYIINNLNGQVAGSSQLQFVVNVIPYTPPPTTTTQMLISSNTTQLYAVNSTSNLMTQTSAQPTISLMPTYTTSEETSQSNATTLAEALVVLLIIAAVVFFAVMWRKREPSAGGQTQLMARYCTQCGNELRGEGSFCGKCGAKQ
ncbi:MAG TPA: zinc ribbon domain-containing protein [Terriglobales bacterium]|nr:zinc ribbon domain-containing protein [Terriglobales bacterium]